MSDVTRRLEKVCHIVAAAGALIEEIRAEGVEAASKDDQSPVTRADLEADALLKRQLLKLNPAGWLSEETADDTKRLANQQVWVVDPLDGTREFMMGLPEYTVAVAFVERGVPVVGVVHNPATGDMIYAARGHGAFRNGQRIHVNEGKTLLASRSELAKGEFKPFGDTWDITPLGSIQLKLALVAAGEAALTFSRGPKHEWDVCAGALIVQEAGGMATDLFGGPLRYNRPFPKVKGILAGATRAYGRAMEQVTALGASERMDEFPDVRAGRGTR